MPNKAKKKMNNPLAGLLSPKSELQQFSTSVPESMWKEFMKILEREEIRMTPAVAALVKMFNEKYREPSARKDFKTNLTSPTATDAFKVLFAAREEKTGTIYGRIPNEDYEEFHEIRNQMKLKVYEATILAVNLFLTNYKNMKKRSA